MPPAAIDWSYRARGSKFADQLLDLFSFDVLDPRAHQWRRALGDVSGKLKRTTKSQLTRKPHPSSTRTRLAPNCNDERSDTHLYPPQTQIIQPTSAIPPQTIQLTSASHRPPREVYIKQDSSANDLFSGAVCSRFFAFTTATPPLPTASALEASIFYPPYFASLRRLQSHLWQLRRTHSTFFPQFIFDFHNLLLPFGPITIALLPDSNFFLDGRTQIFSNYLSMWVHSCSTIYCYFYGSTTIAIPPDSNYFSDGAYSALSFQFISQFHTSTTTFTAPQLSTTIPLSLQLFLDETSTFLLLLLRRHNDHIYHLSSSVSSKYHYYPRLRKFTTLTTIFYNHYLQSQHRNKSTKSPKRALRENADHPCRKSVESQTRAATRYAGRRRRYKTHKNALLVGLSSRDNPLQ
ncbi:hypothetical protein R3P38DRAFT_2764964 [Favolaschia claudopus]|uniref:Uncharacterized protein n=1 Tax=Favolaschia claudopus TaxID=2862362 RepID=A0AAW0DDN9_9AGAR